MLLSKVFALAFLFFAIHPRLTEASPESSADGKPPSGAIVELFTSEGCSSCPPADALLRRVHLTQASSGQLIVGISEHVTYWNSLGWNDPYSSAVFTDRQSAYASRLNLEGPYTPQMVVNGQDQLVGSDSAALQRALRDDARRDHFGLRIVSAKLGPNGVDIGFSFAGQAGKAMDLVAVLTDDADQSHVLRGENGGRLLEHVSVARSLTHLGTVSGMTDKSVHLSLPAGFQPASGPGHHLVLFVQGPHQGPIVAAATVSL
jgi:hypothetical protein